jgi:hypothetical protein
MASFASSSAHFNPGSTPGRFSQLFDNPSHVEVQAPRSIIIDSRDRDFDKFPTPSEYVIKFPTIYKNVTSARLVSAELPSSFYVFRSSDSEGEGNASISVSLTDPLDPAFNDSFATITIPNGNYSFSALEKALEEAMNAHFDDEFSDDDVTFKVLVNRVNLKMTITCSDLSKTITLDTTTTNTRHTGWGLAYYMGFSQKNTQYSGTGSLTSPSVASMNPEMYILISIDPLDRVDETGMYGVGGGTRVFAKVPIAVNSFDVCMYDKQLTCNAILPKIAKLDQVRVRMRFHGSSELIDFNGVDHSLTLELMCEV